METHMKEETIKKKTRQGLTALGAILVLIIALIGFNSENVRTLVMGVALLALYGLPIVIGVVRKHPQIAPIALINVLLGWTVIGWIGALVWSVARFRREAAAPPQPPQSASAE
jgi:uncharacterized membrane protein YccC